MAPNLLVYKVREDSHQPGIVRETVGAFMVHKVKRGLSSLLTIIAQNHLHTIHSNCEGKGLKIRICYNALWDSNSHCANVRQNMTSRYAVTAS